MFQVFAGICLCVIVKVVLIGAPGNGQLGGRRKSCLNFWYKFWTHSYSLIAFFTILKYKHLTMKDVNYYREYLGKEKKKKG